MQQLEEVAMAVSQLVNRRTCLAAVAGALAGPAASATTNSPLDELIADWRMANEEAVALAAEADRILAAADLPTVEVRYGQWRCRYPFEVSRRFDPLIAAWENDRLHAEFTPRLRRDRDELIAELGRQEAARLEAERSRGLTAADALADQASDRAHAIRKEIIAWRPTSMAEVATKNAWLLQQVRDGTNLQDDLAVIFGEVRRG